MSFKFKNSYSFAIKTSIAISLIISFIITIFLYTISLLEEFSIELMCLTAIIFIISFIVIQSRVEAFIYVKIKNLYKDLNLLDSISLSKPDVKARCTIVNKEYSRVCQRE